MEEKQDDHSCYTPIRSSAGYWMRARADSYLSAPRSRPKLQGPIFTSRWVALDHAERMLGARNGWSSAQERIHRVIEIMTGLQTGWDILSETGCKGTFRPSSASKLELERRKRRSDQ